MKINKPYPVHVKCSVSFHSLSMWRKQFTGLKGVLVPIEETIRGFNMIMDGEVDEYPEAAFNLVGTIDDAIEKGKKLMAQAQG